MSRPSVNGRFHGIGINRVCWIIVVRVEVCIEIADEGRRKALVGKAFDQLKVQGEPDDDLM